MVACVVARMLRNCNSGLILSFCTNIALCILVLSLRSQISTLSQFLTLKNINAGISGSDVALTTLTSSSGNGGKPLPLLPKIYVITPTYQRDVQKAELTRLMQTFKHLPRFHWILVEDAQDKSLMVAELLRRSELNFTHLHTPTNRTLVKGRGFQQRNLAIIHLRETFGKGPLSPADSGVVYFADDDNVYDLRLFDLIRPTKKLSFGPVGFVAKVRIEKPAVENGKLVGWDVEYARKAKLRSDMAGFALNLQFLLNNTQMHFKLDTVAGYYEKNFLESSKLQMKDCEVFGMDQLTPAGLREVLVWHTKTAKPSMVMEVKYANRTGRSTDVGWEL